MRTLIAISVLTIAGYLIYRRVSRDIGEIFEDVDLVVGDAPYCPSRTSYTTDTTWGLN
jgi:hypothetical protein